MIIKFNYLINVLINTHSHLDSKSILLCEYLIKMRVDDSSVRVYHGVQK
jgi:hypothetical protein